MFTTKIRLFASTSGIVLYVAATSTAHAQVSPTLSEATVIADDAGEIIVTAQKRSESIQDIPIAMSAVVGEALDRSGIRGIEALQSAVPNLNVGQAAGAARIALRGIGLENTSPGAEGSVAVHLDGAFVASAAAALSAFYDVDRVEVLRGPQGTLYGRNATGGAINIIARRPTNELEGYAGVTYGNYDRLLLEGAVGGALVADRVLARVAFQTEQHDGFGRNIVTGTEIDDADRQSVRGKLELRPTDELSIMLGADYHHENDRNYAYHFLGNGGATAAGAPVVALGLRLGGVVAPDIEDIASDIDPRNVRDFWGLSAEIAYELGDIDLRSLTSYRSNEYRTEADIDNTSFPLAPFVKAEDSQQFSQEFNLSGGSGDLDWLVGAFFFHEKVTGAIEAPISTALFGAPAPHIFLQGYFGGGELKTDAYALFGQATYEVVPRLKLTLGGRYSWERKAVDDELAFDVTRPFDPANDVVGFTQTDDKSFDAFTPRIAVAYEASDRVMLYSSWSKGFKSGTYNLGAVQPVLRPEKVDAYEAGIKASSPDNRLRANLAGFYYDYRDLQVGKVIGQVLGLENAATARIYGLEAELAARPAPGVELNATAAWLHARFRSYISADPSRPGGDGTTVEGGRPAFDLAGNRLSQAPDFALAGGAQYSAEVGPGVLTLRGEVTWTDRVYFSPFNLDSVSQPSTTLANAFLTLRQGDEGWSATAFIKNIGNKRVIRNAFVGSGLVGFPIDAAVGEPRLYGLTLRYAF